MEPDQHFKFIVYPRFPNRTELLLNFIHLSQKKKKMYRISDNLIFKIEKLQVSGLDSVCVRKLDHNKKPVLDILLDNRS